MIRYKELFIHKCSGSLYDIFKVSDVVGHVARIHPFAWSVRVVNGHFRQYTFNIQGYIYHIYCIKRGKMP